MINVKDIRKAGTLLSDEFITILDAVWPDKAPMPRDTYDQIQQQIGATQVIREIKRWKEILDNPDEDDEAYTVL